MISAANFAAQGLALQYSETGFGTGSTQVGSAEAFSSAMGRFKDVEVTLESWMEVCVATSDPLPRKLRITVSWGDHPEFENFHERLYAISCCIPKQFVTDR